MDTDGWFGGGGSGKHTLLHGGEAVLPGRGGGSWVWTRMAGSGGGGLRSTHSCTGMRLFFPGGEVEARCGYGWLVQGTELRAWQLEIFGIFCPSSTLKVTGS